MNQQFGGRQRFANGKVFLDGVWRTGLDVIAADGIVTEIVEAQTEQHGHIASGHAERRASVDAECRIDLQGRMLIPGFIDLHVHGGGGFDVTSGTAADVAKAARFHASKGTTSWLPTTMTAERAVTEQAVQNIRQAMLSGTGGAEIVGIHLEGPFLNPARCGAQPVDRMRMPSQEELDTYLRLSDHQVRLITIAPELPDALAVIRYARSRGITVSIGHSDATYEQVRAAVAAGASHVTHLFNGMRPLHHREPGVAGAALMLDALTVELICDGIHVRPELIDYVFRTKPQEKIVLITDAIEACGCAEGRYQLGGQEVDVRHGEVRLATTQDLAGSMLTMDQALRNAVQFSGLPLASVLPMLTAHPARQIGIADRKGSIAPGKDADLVVLNDKLEVEAVYVRGKQVSASPN
ncbi:N-acetylglucosamine-6-phosphate deacetylase [Xylanibacillus composti]|uniref:N-acetylglucosamine-6-phosphate deacetylase n=1 Tax=Xylanibacillus composti TaxID=1572762 RepID=A0A8J4M2Q1_9BACL|nr:N-acetylglucosamine-6-phosphate deacetylase [Xylanibacillus composti]MDT9726495.1 N-acetylglucosamine-6-phosphate deacetylase [Xylanibacillus composti]GIQ69934.1 N-acetylglucosamine-6-phosphate deacetylase [Xylanibacillus composti]